jgi:hypothetical protein
VIVYANRPREAAVSELLEPVASAVERLRRAGAPDHESAVELLVAVGDLETAVVDAICDEADRETPLTRALRRTAVRAAGIVAATWDGRAAAAERARQAALASLDALDLRALPALVRPRVPEGYVYYSLPPELYLEAARRFALEVRPTPCVCVGLRSIGASLSAVVAAAVAGAGCPTRSYTVRPRGEPFEREISLAPELEAELRRACAGAYVVVVDEGPGLSGSSFTGAARRLAQLGGGERGIVLFPSWQPDPARFVSTAARAEWGRYRSVVASFDEVWVHTGRLARDFGARSLVDLSGGRWRSLAYEDVAAHPAVHPHHERRKYLARGGPDGARLLKFSGLGRYGRKALARAESLAAAGYGPRPYRVRHGFLEMDLVPGRPLTRADAARRGFLEHAAGYLGFLAHADARPEIVRFDDLVEMVRENAGEALGPRAEAEAARLASGSEALVRSGRAVAIDGRMLPHEWLLAGDGRYVKTDGVDHHDDHYFPGRQDVAWDVAGTVVEFDLEGSAERAFVDACRARTGDARLPDRLPFYRAAYLAYRLGYCTQAEHSVDTTEERERFRALRERYSTGLAGVLGLDGARAAVA